MPAVHSILCPAVVIPLGERTYPWPHRALQGDPPASLSGPPQASHRPQIRLPLQAASDELQLGTVVAAICAYNELGCDDRDRPLPDAAAVFAQATAGKLIAHGGIEVLHSGRSLLSPGCCCGLENWREWIGFAQGGPPPDSGHTPEPIIERIPSGLLRLGDGRAPHAAIELPASVLRRALGEVEAELVGFVAALLAWACRLAPAEGRAFVEVLDAAFEWSRPRGRAA